MPEDAATAANDTQDSNAPVETPVETPTDTPVVDPAPVDTPAVKTAQPTDSVGYDMDLDVLLPKPKKVRLNGQIYDVNPPRVKDLIKLTRLAGELQSSSDESVDDRLTAMVDLLGNIMPGLKEDNVDISFTQVLGLFTFISQMANPAENSALKSLGIEPTAEKKITAA